jgi:uncharacterized membrane protein YfcA
MRLVALLFTFSMLFNNVQAQNITADEKLHIGAGAVISGVSYAFFKVQTKSSKKAFWYSLGTATLAGLAKELYDGSRFDTSEWVATAAGGLVVSTSLYIITGKRKEKHKKKREAKIALVN